MLNRFGDHDPLGKMYVLSQNVAAVRAEEASHQVSSGLFDDPIQPLVIRANEGDCVQMTFTNNASGGAYGMHIDGLAFQVGSSGDAVGQNPASSVPQGGSITYRYYVPNDPTLEGTHYLYPGPGNRDAVSHGLFGALAVEPPGSTYLDLNPKNTAPLASGWEASIVPGPVNGVQPKTFREYVQVYHEIGNESFDVLDKNNKALPKIDPFTGAYRPGSKAINYRSEPFFNRSGKAPEQDSQGYGSYTFGDPATPIQRSYLGDPTKIRILHAGSEMFHVFHMHGGGIRWRFNPHADTTYNYADTGLQKHPATIASPSTRLDSQAFGPGESYDLEIEGGAGGVQQGVGEFATSPTTTSRACGASGASTTRCSPTWPRCPIAPRPRRRWTPPACSARPTTA